MPDATPSRSVPWPPPPLTPQTHLHFVTGRLAEVAVRDQVESLARDHAFAHSIGVMPITVAALMTPRWLTRHLEVPEAATHVILPGYCQADLPRLRDHLDTQHVGAELVCGPKDCRDLPGWLTGQAHRVDLTAHSIEIIAEINHVPRRSIQEVVAMADRLRSDGADRIDLGADPVAACPNIGEYVAALLDHGHRVSIDTFDAEEAAAAIEAGASLWLSVSGSNRDRAVDLGCEVVAVPDTPADLASLDETVAFLDHHRVPFRLDPILEPIGSGLMASLLRYHDVRGRYPQAAMMMGIGNLTELTDVDSAGVNVLLLGICQELSITSVLTTQVINWARTSVRECEIGRRLVHHSVKHAVPPKRLSDELVMLRDAKLRPHSTAAIAELAERVRDNNYRLIAQDDRLHLISAGVHLSGTDPFAMLAELLTKPQSDNLDASHAFYLGYEMAKASIALTLGKHYEQDQSLRWGHLTQEETSHRIPRTSRPRRDSSSRNEPTPEATSKNPPRL